jgi:hypothetical protein
MSTQRVATVDATTFADERPHGTVNGRQRLALILFGVATAVTLGRARI